MCGTRIAAETTAAKQNKVREQQSKPQTHAETNEAICIGTLITRTLVRFNSKQTAAEKLIEEGKTPLMEIQKDVAIHSSVNSIKSQRSHLKLPVRRRATQATPCLRQSQVTHGSPTAPPPPALRPHTDIHLRRRYRAVQPPPGSNDMPLPLPRP